MQGGVFSIAVAAGNRRGGGGIGELMGLLFLDKAAANRVLHYASRQFGDRITSQIKKQSVFAKAAPRRCAKEKLLILHSFLP
jgi:hypothetical protein